MNDVKPRSVWPKTVELDVFEFTRRLSDALQIDYDPVSALSQTPNFTGSKVAFAHHWLMYNVLRKYPDLPTGIDIGAVARQEFDRCELKCRETNSRFSERGLNGPFAAILLKARKKIAQVLGDVPPVDQLDLRFGPGGVFGLRGNPTVLDKLTHRFQCTFGLRHLVSDLWGTLPHIDLSECELVHGSRLTFVPKDAKTDRPICIEPVLNGLVQKGIGTYMKKRLLSFGVDLSDQTKNQRLAKLGSTSEMRLATVDLKSASDMVSFGLVYELLPMPWVEFLDQARSHHYHDGQRWREFEKFSSMGCAFTFELETLIFWAISGSLAGYNRVSVYGDDIVVPCEALDVLLDVLAYCGFEPNPNKTFGSGGFRESCGKDYYFGCDSTPFRVKKRIRTVRDVYWLANALRDWSDRWCHSSREERDLKALYHWTLGHVKAKHLYGPKGFGDGHIHVPFDVAKPTVYRGSHNGKRSHPRCYVEGYWYTTYVEEGKVDLVDHYPTAYVLYYAGPLDKPISPGVIRRSHVSKRKRRALGVSWPECGSWF